VPSRRFPAKKTGDLDERHDRGMRMRRNSC
jgi:hypothetical protein